MVYENQLTVCENDLDDLNHVNNVRYVQWMQDIAKEHWQRVATADLKTSCTWVVKEHHIRYLGAAVLADELILKTFIKSVKGAISERVVEIHNKATKQLLIQATTQWCLLHSSSLKPIRITKEITDCLPVYNSITPLI